MAVALMGGRRWEAMAGQGRAWWLRGTWAAGAELGPKAASTSWLPRGVGCMVVVGRNWWLPDLLPPSPPGGGVESQAL